MAKCSIHLKLEEALHGRLSQMAKADRRSVSNFVEKLLHEHPLLTKPAPKLNGHASHKGEKAAAAT